MAIYRRQTIAASAEMHIGADGRVFVKHGVVKSAHEPILVKILFLEPAPAELVVGELEVVHEGDEVRFQG